MVKATPVALVFWSQHALYSLVVDLGIMLSAAVRCEGHTGCQTWCDMTWSELWYDRLPSSVLTHNINTNKAATTRLSLYPVHQKRYNRTSQLCTWPKRIQSWQQLNQSTQANKPTVALAAMVQYPGLAQWWLTSHHNLYLLIQIISPAALALKQRMRYSWHMHSCQGS